MTVKKNKIELLKEERENIIKSYSSKPISKTHIDAIADLDQELQYVIVSDIIEETKDTKSFILIPNKTKGTTYLLPFKAGQYISLKMSIEDAFVTRAYSLSSSPKEASKGIYRITIKRVENGLVSNFMLDTIKVGDELTVSKPVGDFYHSSIRDEENVIAIAGGSGITPFMSFAKAIEEGTEHFHLTVFYSVRKSSDIIFKNEIEAINHKSKKVKFVITLTREEKEGYLNGHLNKDMIEPYLKEFNTFFMCGPKALYLTMNEIFAEFHIPKKSVHFENFFLSYEPNENKTYELKVLIKDQVKRIKCRNDESLLVSMEKEGIKAPSLCRVGICGYCRSILISGKIKMIGASEVKALQENDYIHPCVTYPESDIVLRLDINE